MAVMAHHTSIRNGRDRRLWSHNGTTSSFRQTLRGTIIRGTEKIRQTQAQEILWSRWDFPLQLFLMNQHQNLKPTKLGL